MPRLHLRRLLFTLVAIASCTLLFLNLNSREGIVVKTDEGFNGGPVGEFSVRRKPHFQNVVPITSSFLHEEQEIIEEPELVLTNKAWFMRHGAKFPEKPSDGGEGQLWPNEEDAEKWRLWPHEDDGDRIVHQLMYIPSNYSNLVNSEKPNLKKILLYFGKGGWTDLPLGRTVFQRDKCPVSTCELTTSLRDAEKADAIFFKDRFLWPFYKRSPEQVWILFLLECPLHTQGFKNLRNVFNWTATYRHDSDIVAPYEKFVLYDSRVKGKVQSRDYAANKTKKVAWFVSNCNARNGRLEYAKELAKHIEVDIYGSCGNKRCPRTQTKKCFQMLDRDYKFYLAFENSNCKDYITEKFFVNGLGRDVVPIVMGARPEDYRRNSPHHSYIHVEDFRSPKELAEYLKLLSTNDTLYNEYFQWKGTGEFINTYFWCRLCAMLNAPPIHKSYEDMHMWWAGPRTCTSGKWRDLRKSNKHKEPR